MKKVAIVLGVMLLPVLGFSQYWGPNMLLSVKGDKEVQERAHQNADLKSKIEKEVALSRVEHIRDEKAAHKEQIRKGKMAAKGFELLKEKYPAQAELIAKVAADHDDVVATAAKHEPPQYLYQTLTYRLEELYEDFIALEKANEKAAAVAKIVLAHEYELFPLGSSWHNLADLKDETLSEFSATDMPDGSRLGLRIGGNNYKECEAWYDSFHELTNRLCK